jgi:hypothetical protein
MTWSTPEEERIYFPVPLNNGRRMARFSTSSILPWPSVSAVFGLIHNMRGRGSGARHSRPLFLHDEHLGLIRSQRIFLARQLEHEPSPLACASIFLGYPVSFDSTKSPDFNRRGVDGEKIALS